MTFEILDERFTACIKGTARLDHLFDGCRWAEGPAYFPAHRTLVWSDIPNDRMLRYDEATGNVGVFREPAGYTNGHTVDRQGRLVSCEHGARRVTRTEHDGTITVLADSYRGKRLNSPNDVAVHADGAIYFTDPAYGIEGWYEGYAAKPEVGGCHVYRYDSGELNIVADDFDRPNGLAFTPGYTRLYVSDTGAPKHMRVFDVNRDGSLARGEEFAKCTVGGFDGFRLDESGRIWTSAGDGVHVYDPDGTLIGKVLGARDGRERRLGRAEAQPPLYLRHDLAVRDPARSARRVIDLHVHYPMRLLGGVEAPRDVLRGMTRVAARDHGKIRAAVLAIAARAFNFRHWDASWRVTPQLLEDGGVTVVCSALYRPFSEMDLDEPFGAPPESAYYEKLVELMDATEREVEAAGHVMVRSRADLERAQGKIAFIHCVEGGFHLGAEPDEVAEHVRELAERGVMYITLAHLFWRQVTTNAPALPFLPDVLYNRLFPAAAAGSGGARQGGHPGDVRARRARRYQPHERSRRRRHVQVGRVARRRP